MLIGYARVSTRDQNLDLQIEALSMAGLVKQWMEENKYESTYGANSLRG